MDALLFSIGCITPLFLMAATGYLLKAVGVLTPPVAAGINKLVFNFALPILLFESVATARLSQLFAPSLIAYTAGATAIIFALAWLGAELLCKDKSVVGVVVQGTFRGNYAIIGLFLIESMLGHRGRGAMVVAVVVPLYNILSVLVLSVRGKARQGLRLRDVLRGILTNPLIIGIACGLPFAVFDTPVFELREAKFLTSTIATLGSMANPLALLSIGASLSVGELKSTWRTAAVVSVVKLVVVPLVFLGIAFALRGLLGFDGEDLTIVMVMLCVPTAVASYIMATQMSAHASLAAGIVLLSSVGSVLTLAVFIYFFRLWGVI
ncbi:MAG: AEC family transporter [Prevotellaceae bacterium]|jgi:predicted permease|nr:AEC family transporter [Prevotellaceae bacterium]